MVVRGVTALGWCLMACLLSACGGASQDAPFEDYLDRLARPLGVDVPPRNQTTYPRSPRAGKLRLTLESDAIDALDFLALSGCELQVTIGKRNSSLGKLARASQRLLLELEYLRLAPACVESLRAQERTTLAAALESAWRQKREQVPALIYNATLASAEYRAFWSAQRVAADFPTVGSHVSLAALTAINEMARRWLAGDYRADDQQFEIYLGEVAGGSGGAVLRSLVHQQDWLDAANRLLEARMALGPLCSTSTRHAAADILPNVIRKYFIEGIQPRAAIMERQRFELVSHIHALEQQLDPVLPPLYTQWRAARDSALDVAAGAPRLHVEYLKEIQAPCASQAINR